MQPSLRVALKMQQHADAQAVFSPNCSAAHSVCLGCIIKDELDAEGKGWWEGAFCGKVCEKGLLHSPVKPDVIIF